MFRVKFFLSSSFTFFYLSIHLFICLFVCLSCKRFFQDSFWLATLPLDGRGGSQRGDISTHIKADGIYYLGDANIIIDDSWKILGQFLIASYPTRGGERANPAGTKLLTTIKLKPDQCVKEKLKENEPTLAPPRNEIEWNFVFTFPDRSTWRRLTAKQIENKTKAKIKIMPNDNGNQIKCRQDKDCWRNHMMVKYGKSLTVAIDFDWIWAAWIESKRSVQLEAESEGFIFLNWIEFELNLAARVFLIRGFQLNGDSSQWGALTDWRMDWLKLGWIRVLLHDWRCIDKPRK